jgi:hypothetical protein
MHTTITNERHEDHGLLPDVPVTVEARPVISGHYQEAAFRGPLAVLPFGFGG